MNRETLRHWPKWRFNQIASHTKKNPSSVKKADKRASKANPRQTRQTGHCPSLAVSATPSKNTEKPVPPGFASQKQQLSTVYNIHFLPCCSMRFQPCENGGLGGIVSRQFSTIFGGRLPNWAGNRRGIGRQRLKPCPLFLWRPPPCAVPKPGRDRPRNLPAIPGAGGNPQPHIFRRFRHGKDSRIQ